MENVEVVVVGRQVEFAEGYRSDERSSSRIRALLRLAVDPPRPQVRLGVLFDNQVYEVGVPDAVDSPHVFTNTNWP